MELRQLRYFAKVVEMGSLGRAALELGVGASALSQQLTRLELELSIRLLNRTSLGATPTPAGLAFLHHAQLTLRQADYAVQAAQRDRLRGYVSVGLPPTVASVLALPLIQTLQQRYPDIQLHLVEMLSGYLGAQLNARQLDLAVVFQPDPGRRWTLHPLLDEALILLHAPGLPGVPTTASLSLAALGRLPLVLPSMQHGLRSGLAAAMENLGLDVNVVMEIDGLATLMKVVRQGLAATIQPGSAAAHAYAEGLGTIPLRDHPLQRRNLLASLADDELSPAALATRVVILEVVRRLVQEGRWPGACLLDTSTPTL
ncbi:MULTISPECIES: LysR family transcriptional regulator [unclassified Pseudomonas]|uniref:LysR family transcriptional regulator n=1 Tax=unclassified Pseudomonas TaxID=196821 RepID=UPI00131AD10C|nr:MULTISPECIES: LysR family transcriptional regulator [unclassified Pseudomonas]